MSCRVVIPCCQVEMRCAPPAQEPHKAGVLGSLEEKPAGKERYSYHGLLETVVMHACNVHALAANHATCHHLTCMHPCENIKATAP